MSGKRGTSTRRLVSLYNKRAKRWGEFYLLKQLWRIGAMYDLQDVQQDAFEIWCRIYRNHARKGTRWTPEPDLFRIYKRAMWGRINNRSRQCFPNSFAYASERGKIVADIEGHEELLPAGLDLTKCLEHSFSDDLDRDVNRSIVLLSDAFEALPGELAAVLWILVHDFCGVPCIERRKRKKLSGPSTQESLQSALARKLGVDPSRDLVEELQVALGFKQ